MLWLKNHRWLVWVFWITIAWSCDPWFSYSPYESRLDPSYVGLTEQNLDLIRSLSAGDSKPFRVALLSDTHYHYSKLDEAVADINSKDYFDFAIVTGDIAENGLKQEFIFFHESMSKLTIPYLTVIGNHDYLVNGEKVYSEMYGPYNYTFVFNNVKFVMFDNVRWESEKSPDLPWLSSVLHNDHGYDHVIPFSHIPPFDGQMQEYREKIQQLLVENNIRYSIHGHSHRYTLEELYGGGVWYHTIPSPQYSAYTELSVYPDSISFKKIEY